MREKVALINLGCEKNLVDGEVLMGFLAERYALCEDPAKAHILIINTCTFIEAAREESIEMILSMTHYKKTGLANKVVVVGCMAQRYCDELLEEIPEIDGVFGGEDLSGFVNFLEALERERLGVRRERPEFLYDETMPRVRTSAGYLGYVKIADGCDNCCTYCVLPQTRGPFRSRSMDSVVEEVRCMAAEGVREVIFLAQDTTQYGVDLYGAPKLAELLRRCCRVEGIVWFRLMYCYPERVTDDLIEVIRSEPKICCYMDLPLQHAADRVLAAMNRRYSQREARELVHKLRGRIPGMTLRTTFITGFPGESEEDFEELKGFVRDMGFDHVGVFAYSQEEETPAGRRSDQIDPVLRERRREELMLLQGELAAARGCRRVGETIRVVLEEPCPRGEVPDSRTLDQEPRVWVGRSEGDAPEVDGSVYVRTQGAYAPGCFVEVRVTEACGYDLWGDALEEEAGEEVLL
ncbi:MAG: 30S ribosomal protein S12 methylthiotransferase RimO [Peptococcaceae bacterium]|nr:30S ribosomal protein S12 methylthiotransferase RimO [Peptococcaceae bacterium]